MLEVASIVISGVDSTVLRGRFLDRPEVGERAKALVVSGWVLPQEGQALAVEVARNGSILASTTLGVRRPEVAARFPDIEGADKTGFSLELGEPASNEEGALVVQAVLLGERRVTFGEIRLKRESDSPGLPSGPLESWARILLATLRRPTSSGP